jgi:hypothetical protein
MTQRDLINVVLGFVLGALLGYFMAPSDFDRCMKAQSNVAEKGEFGHFLAVRTCAGVGT